MTVGMPVSTRWPRQPENAKFESLSVLRPMQSGPVCKRQILWGLRPQGRRVALATWTPTPDRTRHRTRGPGQALNRFTERRSPGGSVAKI